MTTHLRMQLYALGGFICTCRCHTGAFSRVACHWPDSESNQDRLTAGMTHSWTGQDSTNPKLTKCCQDGLHDGSEWISSTHKTGATPSPFLLSMTITPSQAVEGRNTKSLKEVECNESRQVSCHLQHSSDRLKWA